jgi:murein DD-endopeptidase MepM/ murein hydrolase activator NlpD
VKSGNSSSNDYSRALARLSATAILVAVVLFLVVKTQRLEAFVRSPEPLTKTVRFAPVPSVPSTCDVVALEADLPVPIQTQLRRGQTLDGLLADRGLEPADRLAAIEALRDHADLRRLRAGDPVTLLASPVDGTIEGLELRVGERGRARVERESQDGEIRWASRFVPFEVLRSVRMVRGVVDGNLSAAVVSAGAPVELAYRMADVLQWDLDFHRDLRQGDSFEVLYEEITVDGRRRGVGAVLALGFVNRDRPIEAYRYGAETAYYDGDGRPLQKMFLRSPLRFSRITSRFSMRRFHPVLKTYRPHYGVDYGAPVGTPVYATARGTVTFAGWNRGGGKTVKLRHANGYLSAYLHLSGYADGLRPGQVVQQGEVVGYVGSTGLSTGPHLDYRVQHRGQWIDPLTLANVEAEPIPAADLAQFTAWREALRASLTGDGSVDQGLLLAARRSSGDASVDGVAPAVEAAGG